MARSIGEVYVSVEANTRAFTRKVQRDAAVSGAFAANRWAKFFNDRVGRAKQSDSWWDRLGRAAKRSAAESGYSWAAGFSRLASRARVDMEGHEQRAAVMGTRAGLSWKESAERAAFGASASIDADVVDSFLSGVAAGKAYQKGLQSIKALGVDVGDLVDLDPAAARLRGYFLGQQIQSGIEDGIDGNTGAARRAGARDGFAYGRAFVRFAKIAMPTNWLPNRMDSTVRAVIISLVVAGGPLVSLLSSLTAGLTAFAGALVAAAAAAGAGLVPILGALGAAAGVLVAGFTGLKDATGELKAFKDAVAKEWKEIQKAVAPTLFKDLTKPLTDAMSAVRPLLVDVAGAINVIFRDLATAFAGLDMGALSGAFTSILAAFTPGLTASVNALSSFMLATAPIAQQMATSFSQIATNMATWLSDTGNVEKLQGFLSAGLDVLSRIGDVLKPLASALMDVVGSAVSGPAQLLLDMFARLAEQFKAFTSSAEGQTALATFFDSIAVAVTALEPVFKGLGAALQQMVTPAAAKAVVGIGEALGALLPIVGRLFNSLAESGILDAFTAAIVQLVGVLNTSGLMDAIGRLASAFGQGLAVVLPTVVRLIDGLAQVIIPVADYIGTMLVPIMEALAPVIDAVAATLVKLAPKFTELMDGLILLIEPLLQPLGDVLLAVAGNVDLLNPIMDLLLTLLGALGPILIPLVGLLAKLLEGVAAGIRLFGTIIGKVIELTTGFVNWFNSLGPVQGTLGLIQTAVEKVTDVIGWLIDKIKSVVDWFGRIEVPDALRTAGDILGNIGSAIGGALGFAAGGVVTSPTRAWIGEAGPEVVIPLTRPLGQVDPSVRSLAAMIRGEGGAASQVMQTKQTVAGPTVNVYPVQADPEAVAYSVANRLAVMAG